MKEVISDKKFFGFDWPPKMPSYPFKSRRKFKHQVIVTSKSNPDWAEVYLYSNEKDAYLAKSILTKAMNSISVIYERKEIPNMDDKGYIA